MQRPFSSASTSQPVDHDIYPVAIAKNSGKLTAFKIWVDDPKNGGAKWFRETYSEKYTPRNSTHIARIHDKWKSLPEEIIKHYKDLENSDINSDENKIKRRRAAERFRRSFAHRHSNLTFETKAEHNKQIAQVNQQRLANIGPVYLPTASKSWDPNTMYESDYKIFLEEEKRKIGLVYGLKKQGENLEKFHFENFTFIGVSLGYLYVDMTTVSLVPIPLEIGMVTFNLKTGINGRKTIHLDIDPNSILQGADDYVKGRMACTSYAQYYGLSECQFKQNKEALIDAWTEFEQFWSDNGDNCQKSRLFCEKSIYNQVKATLRIASACAGMEKQFIFQEKIEKQMIPIEEFALGLNTAYDNPISDEAVMKYFKEIYIPKETQEYCPQHAQFKKRTKLLCQQARGTMLISKFFNFLKEEKLFAMNTIYELEIHELCSPATGEIPVLPADEFVDKDPKKKNRVRDWIMRPGVTANDPEINSYALTGMISKFLDDGPLNNFEGRSSSRNDYKQPLPSTRFGFEPHDCEQSFSNTHNQPPPPQWGCTNGPSMDPPRANFDRQPPSPSFVNSWSTDIQTVSDFGGSGSVNRGSFASNYRSDPMLQHLCNYGEDKRYPRPYSPKEELGKSTQEKEERIDFSAPVLAEPPQEIVFPIVDHIPLNWVSISENVVMGLKPFKMPSGKPYDPWAKPM